MTDFSSLNPISSAEKGLILVTGGAGYIGSHTCLELLNAQHEVVVLDNLSNSSEVSLSRVQALEIGRAHV